jgi:hypothetical protein
MDVGAFFLLFILLVAIILFVARPFRHIGGVQAASGQEVSTLLAERDRILKEIQELDFDNSLGKVPPEEFASQRKTLLHSGVEVLRRLDDLNQARQAESRALAAAAALARADSLDPVKTISDEDLEEMIAQRRTTRKEKTGGFCPKCGKPFLVSDQFCSCCGQPVGVRP